MEKRGDVPYLHLASGKENKMKWYLEITTKKGSFEFPYNGYKTKREAAEQRKLIENDPQTLTVSIIKR